MPDLEGRGAESRPAATLAPEAGTFSLHAGSWSGTYPLAELQKWLAFYRRMRDRKCPRTGKPGARAAIYAPTVAALERIARDVGA